MNTYYLVNAPLQITMLLSSVLFGVLISYLYDRLWERDGKRGNIIVLLVIFLFSVLMIFAFYYFSSYSKLIGMDGQLL